MVITGHPFSVQPSTTPAGGTIAPAVKVRVLDANGRLVTSANLAVTLAIATNPGGGTLSGTLTVNAVNGVATFSVLSVSKAGVGYTLRATAGSLTEAISASFDVFSAFIDFCNTTYRNGKPLSKDPLVRRKLAELAIDNEVMNQIGWQGIAEAQRRFISPEKAGPSEFVGGGVQSVGASTGPIVSKQWTPRFAQAVMEILGPLGLLSAGSDWTLLDGWAERYYRIRGFETHAHGTIEILKMVVATRGLGLPRGPGS